MTFNQSTSSIQRCSGGAVFTFGVLCYCQESIVVETLESIRYQVENHAGSRRVCLIVTDDCSPDATQLTVQRWVEERGDVFSDVKLLFNEENHGVVYNYQAILSRIGDEPFKIIAGDDVIASSDIFVQAEGVALHDLDAHVPVFLQDGRVSDDSGYLMRWFYYAHRRREKTYDLCLFRRGGYVSTPSTLYTMAAYRASDAERLNSGFTLFEDDPTWYSIIRNLADSRVNFLPEPIVLYRLSEQSVSNSSTPNVRFQRELSHLRETYIVDAGSPLERLYLRTKQDRGHLPKPLHFYAYVDRLHRLKILFFCKRHRHAYQQFVEEVDKFVIEQQLFYERIHLRAWQFTKHIGRCDQ